MTTWAGFWLGLGLFMAGFCIGAGIETGAKFIASAISGMK